MILAERARGHAAEDIVVSGTGLISPLGSGVDALWEGLLRGRSPARVLEQLEGWNLPVTFGCAVDELEAPASVTEKQFRRLDPFARFGLIAALAAVADARAEGMDPTRTTIIVGNAVGGRASSDRESIAFAGGGVDAVSPLMPVVSMPNAAAVAISLALGITGPALTVATTCASGADAIGLARSLLRSGSTDLVIAGGCEATLTPVTLAAFARLGALSARALDPGAASRPFDRDRDGFVMGEGGGFMVLERESDARARGIEPRGRILGYGASSDAHHLSSPHPSGRGALSAMGLALRDADLSPEDIGHVNAHGTSTRLNDAVEAAALTQLFGRDRVPPVTAPKGVTGHMLGASGSIEAIAAMRSARTGVIPPIANHDHTDPTITLDLVAGEARTVRPAPALSNSFGFGGHNACLILA